MSVVESEIDGLNILWRLEKTQSKEDPVPIGDVRASTESREIRRRPLSGRIYLIVRAVQLYAATTLGAYQMVGDNSHRANELQVYCRFP